MKGVQGVRTRLACVAACAALVGLGACSRGPTIELMGTESPPRFQVSGHPKRFALFVSTPELPDQGKRVVLWHIRPDRDDLSAAEAGPIVYGTIPKGFRALRFEGDSTRPVDAIEPPPALVEGKVYIATLSVSEANFVSTTYRDVSTCFELRGSRVGAVDCPAREKR